MRVFRTICTAFGMYSRIPVPNFIWTEDDLKYQAAAFPLVGVVIGALVLLVSRIPGLHAAGACLITALPLLVTGGFHMDGFMDTSDALCSYQDREKKMEILKDPHIGSFAVIRAIEWSFLYLAAVLMIHERDQFTALAISFVLSRIMSGLMMLRLRKAKTSGMLYETTKAAGSRNLGILRAELLLTVLLLLSTGGIYGAAELLAAVLCSMYCSRLFQKEFGGITGDLAGFYLTLNELCMALAAAACGLVLQWVN